MKTSIFGSSLLVACLALAGCGYGENEAYLSGQVMVDGQLVPTGSISFFPLEGESPTTGTTITEGKYYSQVPVGESKVEIRIPRKTGSRKLYDTPDSPVQDTFVEALPEKYNVKSELRFNAQSGLNEKDWELSGK